MTRVFDEEPLPPPPPETPEPRLGPTTTRHLVVAALTGVVIGYFVVATLEAAGQIVPLTPWSLALVLVILALVAWWYARALRARIAASRASVSNEEGVRALVVGKTMAIGGAFLVGAECLYVLHYLTRLNIPLPRQRAEMGALTAVGSIAFSLAGLALERACMIPPSGGTGGGSASGASDLPSDLPSDGV